MRNAVSNICEIIRQLSYVLSNKKKKQWIFLFVLTWVGAGMEMLGVSVILPFVQAMLNLDKIMNNTYAVKFLQAFHIENGTTLVVIFGVLIIVIYIIKNLYLFLLSYATNRYQTGTHKELAVYMLHQYLKRPYIYFVNNNSAVIIRNVDGDTSGISLMIQNGMKVLAEGLTVMLICGLLIVTDVSLACSIFAIAVICVGTMVLSCRRIIKENGIAQRKYNTLKSKSIYELLNGIKEIKVMNRRERFAQSYEKNLEQYRKTVIVQNMVGILPERMIEAVCIAGLIGIVCFRVVQGVDPQSFVPQLAVFAVAAFRVLPSIARMVAGINGVLFQKPALQSVYDNLKEIKEYNALMQEKQENAGREGSDCEIEFQRELQIKNIAWKYPGAKTEVLSDVDIVIKKNQSIAFIGESGAGKTTLADIILGLFKPQKGKILLDGIDIETIPSDWSRLVGFVPQVVFLTDDTVRNNIAFGLSPDQIDDDKIWQALDQAQLKEFIRNLPNGLDTIVGERGVKFSGGQKQRIAIARALYNQPKILVLDEATAALDTSTETAVMESIEALQGQVTMIIIAHRLTTIRKCDVIYEITDGKAFIKEKSDVFNKDL